MRTPAAAAEEGAEAETRAELGEMADILPLPPPPAAAPWPLAAGALVLVAALLAARYFGHPLRRLRRRLRAGRISPRQAAHALARHTTTAPVRQRLDELRFGRRGPDAAQVLGLLEEVRRGR